MLINLPLVPYMQYELLLFKASLKKTMQTLKSKKNLKLECHLLDKQAIYRYLVRLSRLRVDWIQEPFLRKRLKF